jgi:hypothetical protein
MYATPTMIGVATTNRQKMTVVVEVETPRTKSGVALQKTTATIATSSGKSSRELSVDLTRVSLFT